MYSTLFFYVYMSVCEVLCIKTVRVAALYKNTVRIKKSNIKHLKACPNLLLVLYQI